MNVRIKQIRKTLKLTLDEFGERIGISKSGLSKIERGVSGTTDQTIRSICREFGVSEVWLRTGEGEMFLPVSEDEQLAEILCHIQMDKDDAFVHTLTAALKAYYHLEDAEKAAVKKLVQHSLDNLQRAKKNTPE